MMTMFLHTLFCLSPKGEVPGTSDVIINIDNVKIRRTFK